MSFKLQLALSAGAAVLGFWLAVLLNNSPSAYFAGKYNSAPTSPKAKSPADHGDLLEYSVVYTDRATNLMSARFQEAMRDLSSGLKGVYNADALALIPGSGTYAMEAVARQFGRGKKCMVIRNGFFSFRWSDIFDQTGIAGEEIVIKARAIDETATPFFAPAPIDEVVARILAEKPDVVFAPHVETATGMVLPDDYMRKVADAVHQVGGYFVLDAIASGTLWVDMKAVGVDVLISAPQKGWSGPACVGIVLMNQRAAEFVQKAEVNAAGSFTCNLKKWLEVMAKYEAGSFMYYTTLPTDALVAFRDSMKETLAVGPKKTKDALQTLGDRARALLEKHGFQSVSAAGYQSPGVVVSYGPANMVAKFKGQGLQIAGGVPFKLDEPAGLVTFRLGLFGLDKIADIDKTVSVLESALLKL